MTEMVWTKTKPDRPGWWLWRNKPEMGLAEIQKRPDGLWYRLPHHTWCGINNSGRNIEWSSEPIPEPSEPPEHELVRELRLHADELERHGRAIQAAQLRHLADKLQAALESK